MEQDRLSNLPKIILHNIMSRLRERDAATTSVLSKTWLDTWYTFPILSFSDITITGMFPQPMDVDPRKRKKFIDHVKRTLLRFHDKGLAIKEFKLWLNNIELRSVSTDVDLWLKLASECGGVEVLELCFPDGPDQDEEGQGECYVLPKGVIEGKSLTKLELMGRIRVDPAFMNHSIQFFSLRVLSLWSVRSRDEHAIQHLISCCPLIEHITLKCYSVVCPYDTTNRLLESDTSVVMKSLSMHGLLKLKTVDVHGIQEIYIDAPCLENFRYCFSDFDFVAPYKIDFDRCQNLKYLDLSYLKSGIITDKWFLELFRKFPFLESLKLNDCTMSKRINISSVQLKVLELFRCSNLTELNIDAPNLLSCGYSTSNSGSRPIISFLRRSTPLEFNLRIPIKYEDLPNLREFLQNIKPQHVLSSLSIFIFQPTVDALYPIFHVSSPPLSMKHLQLMSVPETETLFSNIVYILLSSCCPATISFSPYYCSKAFIEFLYETLMERKEDGCLCRFCDYKCWWHGLKNVKVTSSMKIDENIDFKTLLELLPIGEQISFMLEF